MSGLVGNPFLLASAAGGATGYQIERSLRFNSSDSAYLSRTPASAGNRKTWTWAGWVKRSALGSQQAFFSGGTPDSADFFVSFESDDTLRLIAISGGTPILQWKTSQVFRDPGSWYHIVFAVDTTQATATNRVALYVNGSQVTTFGTQTTPAQNTEFSVNATQIHGIGYRAASGGFAYFSGYLADVHFIDGQALDPSAFVETSATTGQLIPKAYTGSFGTNGFWLKFSDNSAASATTLGKDYSGNSNNWTPNNLSVLDGITAGTGALPIYNTTSNNYLTKSTGTRTDSFSSFIALAVAMDGANGGTTFTDESATIKGSGSAKSLTVTGATTSTAFSKFYGSSGFFGTGGSTPNISISPVNSFAGSNFTIELWYYATASQNDRILYRSVNGSQYGILLYMNGGVIQVYLSSNGSSWDLASGTSIGSVTANQWTHIALVRNGSSFTGYMNGSSTSVVTSSASIASATTEQIGGNGSLSFPGFIQDVRVYIGAAKYTSTFTAPSYSVSTAAGNDSLVDTPTSYGTDTGAGGEVRGNYATLNPLIYGGSISAPTNGNLDISSGSSYGTIYATIGANSGKWYWEFTNTSTGSNGSCVGIAAAGATLSSDAGAYSKGYIYCSGALKANNNSYGSYGASWNTSGDIIGVAFDSDNGTLTFYKNGSSQGQAYSGIASTTEYYFPVFADASGSASGGGSFNFGQRPFAYTAPSGFKALCDTSLPAPVVAKPSEVMDAKLYTGNGSTQTISGLGFSPDLVWIKSRSAAYAQLLYDTVRGAGLLLRSDSTTAESGNSGDLLGSFNSDGFAVNNTYLGSSNPAANDNTQTYVAWTWDAGSSTVTNTQGSITSQVRANASAGFSVATLTTPSSGNFTVGHGLNIAPSLVICKARNQAFTWIVYHKSAGAGNYLVLNTTAASTASSTVWQNTDPSSTLVYGNASNWGTADYVMYSFAPVAGYSNAFSFVGNGSTDGPAVWLGFRPRFVILKASSSTSHWHMMDSARQTYNQMNTNLFANLSNAELSDPDFQIDFLSNGFKLRTSGPSMNGSGVTYIGYAWAENPFQYARAR